MLPAGKGDPEMGVSTPVVELIVYPETVPLEFATYANLAVGSTATDSGDPRGSVGKGEPEMGVSAPVSELIVYPETFTEPVFAT